MSAAANSVPLTEPEIIPCLWASGVGVEINDSVVRFVFWNHLPEMGSDSGERRIVGRFVMSNAQARNFQSMLRKAFARGGN